MSNVSNAAVIALLLQEPAFLLKTFAPNGWEASPYFRAFHPTIEQRRAADESIIRNVSRLTRKIPQEITPLPDSAYEDQRPIEPAKEIVELLGLALWDVFSNNHAVLDASGNECDLGSFRGSAGYIANALNARYLALEFDLGYMDFYMGSSFLRQHADLSGLYEWIFGELRRAGYEWQCAYSPDNDAADGSAEQPIVSAYRAAYGKMPDVWQPPA